MEARKQFTFYRSFYEAICHIKNKSARLAAYEALCAYALDGKLPADGTMPDAAIIAFSVMRPVIEAGRIKAESGSLGGKANGKQTEANGKQTEANGKQIASKDKDKDKNKNKYKCTPPAPSCEDVQAESDFDIFWALYPKHTGKADAQEEWKRLNPASDVVPSILGGLRAWIASYQWREQHGRFIPKAENFLRDRLWELAPRSEHRELDDDELAAIERIMREDDG